MLAVARSFASRDWAAVASVGLAPEVSRLLGIRVSRMLTIGWMLSAGVGAIAAVITASATFGLFPTDMDGIFVAGFIAAAVGGLESPIGAVAGRTAHWPRRAVHPLVLVAQRRARSAASSSW
jgi:branched-subunit amino acid ABC-type transport system permease component